MGVSCGLEAYTQYQFRLPALTLYVVPAPAWFRNKGRTYHHPVFLPGISGIPLAIPPII